MKLETERLYLKPYDLSYADAVYDVVKQKEIADTMIMIPHPYPRESVEQWITYLQDSFISGTAYEFAVFLKENGRYIGNCGFVSVSHPHQRAEVGYFIDRDYWGRGYATEACAEMLAYGFRYHQFNRISGRCMTRNTASRTVMEKCGMAFEGRHEQEFLKNGVYEYIDYFAILAEQYVHHGQRDTIHSYI